jgi:hypothetical protein
MSRFIRIIAMAMLFATVAWAAACGSATRSSGQSFLSPSPIVTGSPSGPSGAMPVKPHFQKMSGGQAVASGWLRHVDLEGGFWALIAEPPGVPASSPTIVAVLLPGKVSQAQLAAHDGAYLFVTGKVATGASMRMAGPEIVVAGVKLLGMGQ